MAVRLLFNIGKCYGSLAAKLVSTCVTDNKDSITGTLALIARNSFMRKFRIFWKGSVSQFFSGSGQGTNLSSLGACNGFTIPSSNQKFFFRFLIWDRSVKRLKHCNKVSGIFFCDKVSDFLFFPIDLSSSRLCLRQISPGSYDVAEPNT